MALEHTIQNDTERRNTLNAERNPRTTTPDEATQTRNPLTGDPYWTDRQNYSIDNGGVFDLHAKLGEMDLREFSEITHEAVERNLIDNFHATYKMLAEAGFAGAVTDGAGVNAARIAAARIAARAPPEKRLVQRSTEAECAVLIRDCHAYGLYSLLTPGAVYLSHRPHRNI